MYPNYNYNPFYNYQAPVRTSIFYFNDTHSKAHPMGSLKTAADYFTQTRNSPFIDTFKLSAGDNLKGENANLNASWNEFLNIIGLDASALGNHELDQGAKNFSKNTLKANYKYVSSNIEVSPFGDFSEVIKQDKLVKSWVMNKNGHLYGILGLSPNDSKHTLPGRKLNNPDIKVKDTATTLTELQNDVNRLKQAGINKIILVSHFDDDENLIPKNVSGIDVIVSGHQHNVYKGLVPEKNLFYSPTGEPIIKVEGGRDGKYLGILDLAFDAYGRIISANNNLMETKSFPEDPSITAIKMKYNLTTGSVSKKVNNPALPDYAAR